MSKKVLRTLFLLIFVAALCAPTTLLAALSVNVNTASVEQLQQIKGVGPKTAAKIVEYRDTHGQFSSIDELSNVNGIGEKSLAKMEKSITLE
jgi:competence protein ComEA